MKPGGKYFVVSNNSVYGREIQAKYPENVFLIKGSAGGGNADTSSSLLDTYNLLALPEVQNIIDKLDADLVVFQNTPRIERLAQEMHWNLLNPSAALALKVEEKISQVAWLGKDADLLPPHHISLVKDVIFTGAHFVLQFNHSHTGQGTYVITTHNELSELKVKFPERECRVVDFIDGPVFTVNASVNPIRIIVGSPSYQITGLQPFTDLPFSTIGNDWALPNTSECRAIAKIARVIGKRLKKAGWRGLFGIDAIKDARTGNIHLLEINARQAASAVYESALQDNLQGNRIATASLFQAHLAGLFGYLLPLYSPHLKQGAQIVARMTNIPHKVDVQALRRQNLRVMEYENSIHNKELFRIQAKIGIMESHNVLGSLGKTITSCIK
jgi:hypothetical protein